MKLRFGSLIGFVFTCFCILPVSAGGRVQSYGLQFASHEVVQDQRTSLDLSPGKSLNFAGNFQLSFDLSFAPHLETYFGYVVRIIENDKRNIDLVYDAEGFNVIIGDKLSPVSFKVPKEKLFNHWTHVVLKFDVQKSEISLEFDGKRYLVPGIRLKYDASYKFLFGANQYGVFRTTDVPPIRIKQVEIASAKHLLYQWPLNESNGAIAYERLSQQNGIVGHAVWVGAMHFRWSPVLVGKINGPASVAFNPVKEELYVVSEDSLYTFSGKTEKWSASAYRSGKINLNAGSQSVYNPLDGKLYNVILDQKFLISYNFETQSWDKSFEAEPMPNYWHFNKIFSGVDTALYTFGGYGQLLYKNSVFRYELNHPQWEKVQSKGDFFKPRYLSAIGASRRGDTAYILGGYGSTSGKQILNPKNIYEMLAYSFKTHTFKKLFDLDVKDRDFAFANSLVIDHRSRQYYGLVFSEHQYNSSLRMIVGSLDQPKFSYVGSEIPYPFHDTKSFSDLFYSDHSKKFIAVTLLWDKKVNQTQVKVFTLLGPPSMAEVAVTGTRRSISLYYWLVGCLVLAGGVFWVFNRRVKFVPSINEHHTNVVLESVSKSVVSHPAEPEVSAKQFSSSLEGSPIPKNTIMLFGNFQVFDAEGTEITKYFTPVVKELFLIILLHSVRWGRGISSEKLDETLWFDKSAKSARNNRSVTITKLKSLLEKMDSCLLSKDTGYWKIEADYTKLFIDYKQYLLLVNNKELNHQLVEQITDIVKRGSFLINTDYEWLDTFKSEVSNDIIDKLVDFIDKKNAVQHSPELSIKIADLICYFDTVNEDAMMIKCRALSTLGKHSLARQAFESFSKEYRTLYGEDFKRDFPSVTS